MLQNKGVGFVIINLLLYTEKEWEKNLKEMQCTMSGTPDGSSRDWTFHSHSAI
jgi:hypothetical protein